MTRPHIVIRGLHMHDSLFQTARGKRCQLDGCRGACCVNGIWVDVGHVQKILAQAEAVKAFLAPEYRNEDEWFGEETFDSTDFPSGIGIPTAVGPRPGDPERQGCVFLRPDHTCGLQVASAALGLGFPGLKPIDCATYPLVISEGALEVDDKSPEHLGGADCQQACDAPRQPMYVEFRTEVELAIGTAGWQRLDEEAHARGVASEGDEAGRQP